MVAPPPVRRHVIADVVGCRPEVLDDIDLLDSALRTACADGGAAVLGGLSHHFVPQGVTILVLLAESHASIHTWPECGIAFVDVFTCGGVEPEPIAEAL